MRKTSALLLFFALLVPAVRAQTNETKADPRPANQSSESKDSKNSSDSANAQQPGDDAPTKPEDVLKPLHYSLVITATPLGPEIERRNSEVFEHTLFSRDDQIFHLLDAGINAG
jgi:hypothetical protein